MTKKSTSYAELLSDPNASIRRRLAAILYDFFLIFALWAVTGSGLLAFFGDSAPSDGHLPDNPLLSPLLMQVICYTETFLFYFYFWQIKGQTLGMQVWKIRLINQSGQMVTAREATIRFACATIAMAPAGLGLLWALVNKEHKAAQDIWSNTRVVYVGGKPYESEKSQIDLR